MSTHKSKSSKRKALALHQKPLVAAVITWVAATAWADESDSTMDELIVMGHYIEETLPQQLAQSGSRLEVVTEDVIKLGSYYDMSQTIQMEVPGFYIAQKSGAFDYMNCSLQGSRCSDILWLIDGVRMNNRLYANTTPLDTIPAHMVERVEVLYGGQGVFYGTQSIAGVVNVVTKAYSDESTGSVTVGGNSNGGQNINADYRGTAGVTQFVLYASHDEADGFQAISDEDLQPSQTHRDRSYEVESYGIKLGWDINENSRLSLHYDHTDAYLDNMRAYLNSLAFNDRDEDLLTLKYDLSFSDTAGLFVKAYSHTWDSVWSRFQNDLDNNGNLTGGVTAVFEDTYWGYEDRGVNVGARIESEGGLLYTFGYDYQKYSAVDDVWIIVDETESVNAVFAQISNNERLMENTTLSLGARYNKLGSVDDSIWNFTGEHHFTDALSLRGSVGTAFRLPDAEELYLNDCCEVGNPDLEPEESFNTSLGLVGEHNLSNDMSWRWSFDIFAREIDNLIEVDYSQPAYPDGIFMNLNNSVESKGYEFTSILALNSSVSINFDYVHTEAEEESSSQQLQDVPEDTIKLGLTYIPSALPLELRVNVLSVSDVYDEVGRVGRFEHGGYTILDIGGAWYLGTDRHHRLGFKLENATDKDYKTRLGRGIEDATGDYYAYGFLGTPRTAHINYTYNF